MSMNLDKRQRAMLREMGIRVWQPLPEPASDAAQLSGLDAIKIISEDARSTSTRGGFDAKTGVAAAIAAPVGRPPEPVAARPARPISVASPASAASAAALAASPAQQAENPASCWGLAPAQLLYAATGADSEPAKTGARWLVLAEVPAAALELALASPSGQFNAFEGDAGRLLDNMLRAARLHRAGAVHLVAIARDMKRPPDADAPGPRHNSPASLTGDLASALPALMAAAQPDLVLVMGRFAGQALLQTDLPFGKLRGQAHSLLGKPAIVTYDASYLLRQQLEKARAWDDLRLAMGVAAGAAGH